MEEIASKTKERMMIQDNVTLVLATSWCICFERIPPSSFESGGHDTTLSLQVTSCNVAIWFENYLLFSLTVVLRYLIVGR